MGWRDAPIVDEQAQPPVPAWQAAPTVGGEAMPQPPAGPAPRVPRMPQQVQEGPAPMPQQVQEGVTPTVRETPLTMREGVGRVGANLYGGAEVLGTVGTGGVAEILAGLAGIEELARGGDDRVERASERIRRVQEMRTFEPRTEEGRRILEALGIPFIPFTEGGPRAGAAVQDAGASPGVATAVDTTIQAIPAIFGMRTGRPGAAQRRADVRRIDEGASELGVRLNEGVTAQRQQLERAAERMAAGGVEGPMGQPAIPPRGFAAEGVQQGMVAARDATRDAKNAMFAEAKQTDAHVTLDNATGLAARLDEVRQNFLTQDMPAANRLLGEVEQLRRIQRRRDELIAAGGQPREIAVTINQFEEWGQKIRRNQPSQRADPAQHAAMERMLRIKEDFMDDLFNADMVSGNPEAIAAWRRARAANASYRERFSDNKVIRDMVEMNADPETVRKWIFGANAAGARTEAATVVRRIREELGEDSPQFTALRQDAVLDILDPLLGPEPNLRGFVRKYDQFVGRNRTLANELFGDNLEALTNLRDLAQAHRNRPVVAISELPGAARILSVFAFGHELARRSLSVRAGATAATMLARTATPSARRRMMGEILGYDPFQPMFGGTSLAILAASQELGQEETERQPGALDNLPAAQRRTLERLRGGP